MAIITALTASLPKQSQAEYVDYLKRADPSNIILEVQKERQQRKVDYEHLNKMLSFQELHFIDFEFERLHKVSDSININNPQDYKQADTLIKGIAHEVLKISDSLDVKESLKGLLRLKIHFESQEIERLLKRGKWQSVIKRYFGLYSLAKHLGNRSHERRFFKLWQKYAGLLR